VAELPRFDLDCWQRWRGQTERQIRQSLLEEADLIHSVGPWLAFPNAPPVFDGLAAGFGLGYNSSPLFGVLQHAATWTADQQDQDFLRLIDAYQRLLQRKPHLTAPLDWGAEPRLLIANYIAANVLDQFQQRIELLLEEILAALKNLSHSLIIRSAPHSISSIELHFNDLSVDPFQALLNRGVLSERLSDRSVQLRIPSMLTDFDIRWLVEQVGSLGSSPEGFDPFPHQQDYSYRHYRFHSQLLRYKQSIAQGRKLDAAATAEFVRQSLPPSLIKGKVAIVDDQNWSRFRQQVQQMQHQVYEPARQTAIEKFDALLADPCGFGIVVTVADQIAGMGFGGPLSLFPEERGTLEDPFRSDQHTLYVLDVTVAESYRGNLGTLIKQGMMLHATAARHAAIHGRNRDRLAGAMWAINLGLGSYQLQHLQDDYPDQEKYRDCIYYRCPLRWPPHWGNNSQRFTAEFLESDQEDLWANLAKIVNRDS